LDSTFQEITSARKCESVAIGLLHRIDGTRPRTRREAAAVLYSQNSRRSFQVKPNSCRSRSGSRPIPIALPKKSSVPSTDGENNAPEISRAVSAAVITLPSSMRHIYERNSAYVDGVMYSGIANRCAKIRLSR